MFGSSESSAPAKDGESTQRFLAMALLEHQIHPALLSPGRVKRGVTLKLAGASEQF